MESWPVKGSAILIVNVQYSTPPSDFFVFHWSGAIPCGILCFGRFGHRLCLNSRYTAAAVFQL